MCNRTKLRAVQSNHVEVNVRIIAKQDGEDVADVYEYHNLKTNDYLNLLRDIASGDVSDGEIKIMAWGTDATAPAATQTALLAEAGRKAVTRHTDGSTGVVIISTTITSTEAVGTSIGEFGLFAGSAATLTAGSGVMAARVNWAPAHTKTATESIQVDWQLTFS
jgi:hypothetical protein